MSNFETNFEAYLVLKLIDEPQNIHLVRKDYFELDIAKHIYSVIEKKIEKNEEVSQMSIAEAGANDKYRNADLFIFYADLEIRFENLEYFARILKDRYYKRKVIQSAAKILNDSNTPTYDFYDSIVEFENLKAEIDNSMDVKVLNLKDNINNSITALYERKEKLEKGISDYESGLKDFDKLVVPEKGNVMCIAARPSVGKTSFTNQVVKGYARRNEKGAYFSLEITNLSLSNRFLLGENDNIDVDKFKKGASSHSDIQKLEASVELFNDMNVYLRDNKHHIDEIIQEIDILVKQKQITYAVIDFIQIIQGEGRSDEERISKISTKLKACALRNKILIIPLSQLNRNVESRGGSRHQLSDLRGSGSLEQDCDIIVFLFRQAKVDKDNGMKIDWHDQEVRTMELQVLKNKNGESGDVKVYHNKTISRFWDIGDLTEGRVDYDSTQLDDFDKIIQEEVEKNTF